MKEEEFQEEVYEWSKENFGEEAPAQYPLIGAGEEAGELTTSVLKRAQGIGDSEKYEGIVGDEAERDAVGDIRTYLADMMARGTEETPPQQVLDMMDFYICYGRLCESVFRRLNDDEIEKRHRMVLASLEDFCDTRGFDLDECTQEAWEEVSGREWDSDVEVQDG